MKHTQFRGAHHTSLHAIGTVANIITPLYLQLCSACPCQCALPAIRQQGDFNYSS